LEHFPPYGSGTAEKKGSESGNGCSSEKKADSLFFFKCSILFEPGNLLRCILHIENVLAVISIPICPHLIKANIQRYKKKPTTVRLRRRSGDVGIHATELYSPASGVYSVWRRFLSLEIRTGMHLEMEVQLSLREAIEMGKTKPLSSLKTFWIICH